MEILSLAEATQSRLARIVNQADRCIARIEANEKLARLITHRWQTAR